MSLLDSLAFLSEATGIAVVDGLLSVHLLNRKILLVNVDHSTNLYRNLLLLFAGGIIDSWLVAMSVYKRARL